MSARSHPRHLMCGIPYISHTRGQPLRRLEPKARDLHVFVCHGTRCSRGGAPRLRALLARTLKAAGVRARLTRTSCQGHCKRGPVVFVERPKRRVWGGVGEADVERVARKLARLLAARAG